MSGEIIVGRGRGQKRVHDEWLRGVVQQHLPPLQSRVRRSRVELLVERLLQLEPAEAGLLELSEPLRNTALVHRMRQIVEQLEREAQERTVHFARFSERYGRAQSDPEREHLILRHLEETVEDGPRLRGDIRAIKRFLGPDVLRERAELDAARLLVTGELGLYVLGGVAERALTGGREAIARLLDRSRLLAFLRERVECASRWQSRLAAAESLVRVVRALAHEKLLDLVPPGELRAILHLASRAEPSPWVQGAVLELVFVAMPEWGKALLRRRLLQPGTTTDDFLVRRKVLDIAARCWSAEDCLDLVAHALEARDPSEHVRLGLCEALAVHATPRAQQLLWQLAGLSTPAIESSPKVRASALIAARRIAVADPARAGDSVRMLVATFAAETHPLVLRIACEEVAALATTLGQAGQADALAEGAPLLREALTRFRSNGELPAAMQEKGSETLEILERELSPVRRAWTRHIAEVASHIAPGKSQTLALAKAEALPPLPEDPLFLGRMLADVSRNDFGLYARRDGDSLRLWRGDVFKRRLWRILHELRNPAPNKRQAFVHTVGRSVQAELRAHPGGMHEVTATVVPGERLEIGGGSGWGRHLPTVDDLLDLPVLSPRPVHVFSSHGVTTLHPAPDLKQRLRNRMLLTRRYQEFAALRLSSLRGRELHERRKYLEAVEEQLCVRVEFAHYDQQQVQLAPAPTVSALFQHGPCLAEPERTTIKLGGWGLLSLPIIGDLADQISMHGHYFASPIENGPQSLLLFTSGLITLFLADAWRKRASIAPARESIPLCIGGWGTRGKSGTERLKAALFHGLGFEVFSKTTGSEAMFIHSTPSAAPAELFIFRPYDKATIWEQKDMLLLGSRLKTEVFLWECMALNPQFVELLEHDWMRDDLTTLTNAYPDHEDIQGPAGMNVAEVITRYIPQGATCVTSEDNFLPLFQEVAKARKTQLLHVPDRDAELLADDVLARFPYQEHPRNIALVARLAEELGVDRTFAISLMADHIVPELGNLKIFPPTRVAGRTLTFINGHSANERTGFMNNWTRTGCDSIDPVSEPDRMMVVVVNNRWDRVARSEVFARILVEDAAADRHVLIGTNLKGLCTYVETALDRHLAGIQVAMPEELSNESGRATAHERLTRQFRRLRVAPPEPEHALQRLRIYAKGAGLQLDEAQVPALTQLLTTLLAEDSGELSAAAVRERIAGDASTNALIDGALQEAPPPEAAIDLPEVLEQPARDEVKTHFFERLAHLIVHARLHAQLKTASDAGAINDAFRKAFREIFLANLDVVADAGATGDQIIERCARTVPPGTRVTIMGIQNIKGTGLDWVYRWVSLDAVRTSLAKLTSDDAEKRERGLRELETFEDHGLVDAALAKSVLGALLPKARSEAEAQRLKELLARVEGLYQGRRTALASGRKRGRFDQVLGVFERGLDYLDSVHRRRASEVIMEDLIAQRISHPRAVLELRKLNARQKGGWLSELVRGGKG